jgi:hypothetical protein
MWRKVADGVWCTEDADGMPAALATSLDDGTPLRIAEQWWGLGQRLLDWVGSDAERELPDRYGIDPDPPFEA